MNQKVWDVLHNREDHYVLPFVWMHGAAEGDTRRLMQAVYDCGIRAVCLESRPHPDFVGEQWWHDMDIMIEEARSKGMKLWILDDSHFPTGYANGAAVNVPRHLKRISLTERHYDIQGPQNGTKIDISRHLNLDPQTRQTNEAYYQERLESVLLARIVETPGTDNIVADVQNVTDQVEDGWLYLELPEGKYRVYVLTTKLHAAAMMGDGISLLEKESVRLLIDAVYEPHYRRYAPYFGNTIAGFFSDEPGFFNLGDRGYGDVARTGEESVPLPWTDDVYAKLKESFGDRTDQLLPCLLGAESARQGEERAIRVRYMEIVSEKYAENFSGQLGQWCREHKAAYIGHIVEDAPGYERLGQSAAHYFRAVRAQDMAGIDIVLNDLLPDEDTGREMFYHYGLAQLAGSLASQAPHQQGRALCEIFGAYGWAEGVTLMKWMADHMLTGGINHFVPHAFTDKDFPDPDCPPHFWARGNNPQYPFMSVLFGYMDRMSHLLDGGVPLVQNAVLFEAESDWAGETQAYYVCGRELLSHQIPYHVVCLDALDNAGVKDGQIGVGRMYYQNLFVPQLKYMSEKAARILGRLAEAGASLFFVGKKPADYAGGELCGLSAISCISMEEMTRRAGEAAELRITVQETASARFLRCYSYCQKELKIHMLQNASSREKLSAQVVFSGSSPSTHILYLDVMEQRLSRTKMILTPEGKQSVSVSLGPMESVVCLEGGQWDGIIDGLPLEECQSDTLTIYGGNYWIRRADFDRPQEWQDCGETCTLYDIARRYPGFAGKVRYELDYDDGGYGGVLLEGASDAVEVYCDGISLGKRIAPPYRYVLPEFPAKTRHRLWIEVSTTLVNAIPDTLSCQRPIAPTGFLGKVYFWKRQGGK